MGCHRTQARPPVACCAWSQRRPKDCRGSQASHPLPMLQRGTAQWRVRRASDSACRACSRRWWSLLMAASCRLPHRSTDPRRLQCKPATVARSACLSLRPATLRRQHGGRCGAPLGSPRKVAAPRAQAVVRAVSHSHSRPAQRPTQSRLPFPAMTGQQGSCFLSRQAPPMARIP